MKKFWGSVSFFSLMAGFSWEVDALVTPWNIIRPFAGNGGTSAFTPGLANATSLITPVGISYKSDNFYLIDSGVAPNPVYQISGLNNPAISLYPSGSFNAPKDTYDGNSFVYVADAGDQVVYKVDMHGNTSIFAGQKGTSGNSGNGGAATTAQLNQPTSIVGDSSGNIYIGDRGNKQIRKVDSSGTISTYASFPYQIFGMDIDTNNNIYAVISNGDIYKVSAVNTSVVVAGNGNSMTSLGDGGLATNASFSFPSEVAVDKNSDFYVPDGGFNLRRISAATNLISSLRSNTGSTYPDGSNLPINDAKFGYLYGIATSVDGSVFITDIMRHYVYMLDAHSININQTTANGGTYTVDANEYLTYAESVLSPATAVW